MKRLKSEDQVRRKSDPAPCKECDGGRCRECNGWGQKGVVEWDEAHLTGSYSNVPCPHECPVSVSYFFTATA